MKKIKSKKGPKIKKSINIKYKIKNIGSYNYFLQYNYCKKYISKWKIAINIIKIAVNDSDYILKKIGIHIE